MGRQQAPTIGGMIQDPRFQQKDNEPEPEREELPPTLFELAVKGGDAIALKAQEEIDEHQKAIEELEVKATRLEREINEKAEKIEDFRDTQDAKRQEAKDLKVDDNLSNFLVVDNVPKIPGSKVAKLMAVLKKFFGRFGKVVNIELPGPPEMAENPKIKTLGFAFIEFRSASDAAAAQKKGDKKKLDNKHTFRCNLFTDFEKYASVPDEYEAPEDERRTVKTDLQDWLCDPALRNQLVVRQGNDTEIFWNAPIASANKDCRELCYGGEREKEQGRQWTQLYVQWSSKGTYLATFHSQGIVIWGGNGFESIARFKHKGVKLIDFSPCERYLVTSNCDMKSARGCIFWDILTGKEMRAFDCGIKQTWPIFHWSADGNYAARVAKDKVQVYGIPHMGLLDKQSIEMRGVQEVKWSPRDNIFVAWVPEYDNQPASLHMIEIPSKKKVRERHFFSVQDIKLHWQSEGEYLAAKLAMRKSKKTIVSSFEIFRMHQKNIPVEVMEIEEDVIAFSWGKKNKGSTFAIVHGNNAQRNEVTFYKLSATKMKKLKTLESRQCNCLFWSPSGQNVILAGLGPLNGIMEFVDADTMTTITTQDHFMCTDIEWDSSGRYLLSATTQPLVSKEGWRHSMENGYKLWSAQGKLLTSLVYPKLYQVLWRPRPKCMLTAPEIKELRETMRNKYWKTFDEMDEKLRQGNLSGRERERQAMKEAWKKYRESKGREYKELTDDRKTLRGCESDDEGDYVEVETIEETEISKVVSLLEDEIEGFCKEIPEE